MLSGSYHILQAQSLTELPAMLGIRSNESQRVWFPCDVFECVDRRHICFELFELGRIVPGDYGMTFFFDPRRSCRMPMFGDTLAAVIGSPSMSQWLATAATAVQ